MNDPGFDIPLVGESHKAAADALCRSVDEGAGGACIVCARPGGGASRVAADAVRRAIESRPDGYALTAHLSRGESAEVAAVDWLARLLAEPLDVAGDRVRWRRLVATVPELSGRAAYARDRSRPAADALVLALAAIARCLPDEGRLVVWIDLDGPAINGDWADVVERLIGAPVPRLSFVVSTADAEPLLRKTGTAGAVGERRFNLEDPTDAEIAERVATDPAFAALSESARGRLIERAGRQPLALAHFAREVRPAAGGGDALVRTLPLTLRERIETLARTADPDARRLVETLAVLDRTVDVETLAALAGVDPRSVRATLIAPPASLLVESVPRPERPPAYRVRHALYADWIAGSLGGTEARARLGRFAEAFLARFEADPIRTGDLAAWADCLDRTGDKRRFAEDVEAKVVRLHALRQYELLHAVEHRRLAIFREVGFARGEAAALFNLGEVHRAWGRHDRAMAHLKKGMALFASEKHPAGEAAALASIGEIHRARGETDRALVHYRRAQRLFEDAELPRRATAVQKKIDALSTS